MDYIFSVPGIRNPIQTIPTGRFIFETFNKLSQPIDQSQGAQITMITPAELSQVRLSLSSYTNSMPVSYSFIMVPSVPVSQKNMIMVTFPPETRLPANSADLACANSFREIVRSVSCSYDVRFPKPNTIKVELVLAEGRTQINA